MRISAFLFIATWSFIRLSDATAVDLAPSVFVSDQNGSPRLLEHTNSRLQRSLSDHDKPLSIDLATAHDPLSTPPSAKTPANLSTQFHPNVSAKTSLETHGRMARGWNNRYFDKMEKINPQHGDEDERSKWFNCYLPPALMVCVIVGNIAIMILMLFLLTICLKAGGVCGTKDYQRDAEINSYSDLRSARGSNVESADARGNLPSWAID